jgi:hypothetical protein
MFEFYYAQESQIPADHKQFYENRDGGWYLKVKGVVQKEKLDEFRRNNDDLKEEVKTLKDKLKPYDGVDVTKYHDLLGKEEDLRDEELLRKKDVDQIKERALAAVKSEHERQIKAKDDLVAEKENKITQLTGSLKKITIDKAILQEASKRGVMENATDFILAIAERAWDLNAEGKPVVKGDDGKIRYGKNGDEMQPSEWLDELVSKHQYIVRGNTGSGAPAGASQGSGAGGSGAGMPAGYNPFKVETNNITKQMEIYKKDPAEARRLATAAGRDWNQIVKSFGGTAVAA